MRTLLAATAGSGRPQRDGDWIGELPAITECAEFEFWQARYRFSLRPELGTLHAGDCQLPALRPQDGTHRALRSAGPVLAGDLAALGSAIVDDYLGD